MHGTHVELKDVCDLRSSCNLCPVVFAAYMFAECISYLVLGVHVALGRRSLRPEGSAGPGYGYGAVDGAVKRMNQWLSTSNAFDGRETGEKDSFMPLRFRNRNQNRKLTIRAQKRASEEIRVMCIARKLRDQCFLLFYQKK